MPNTNKNTTPEDTAETTNETKVLMEQIQRDIQRTKELQKQDPSILHASTVPPEQLIYCTEHEWGKLMEKADREIERLQKLIAERDRRSQSY